MKTLAWGITRDGLTHSYPCYYRVRSVPTSTKGGKNYVVMNGRTCLGVLPRLKDAKAVAEYHYERTTEGTR